NILDKLHEYTNRLVVSIVDPYRKTKKRIGSEDEGVQYTESAYSALLSWIAKEAHNKGIEQVQSCAEPNIKIEGINQGRCIDAELLAEITGVHSIFRAHKQRVGCGCHQS